MSTTGTEVIYIINILKQCNLYFFPFFRGINMHLSYYHLEKLPWLN